MLDRLFDNWCNEAGRLLNEATAAQIIPGAGIRCCRTVFRSEPGKRQSDHRRDEYPQAAEEGAHYAPVSAFRSRDAWVTVRPGERVLVPTH
jgi:enoyl-CoA hydratase/3-hydroxyacyl-CoA dehydrogenase